MVRFTKRCVCEEELQAAYHDQLDLVCWNCFRCFPLLKRATPEQERALVDDFRRAGLLK